MAKYIYNKYNLNTNYTATASPPYDSTSTPTTWYKNYRINESGQFVVSIRGEGTLDFSKSGYTLSNNVLYHLGIGSGGRRLTTPYRVTTSYSKGTYIGQVTAEDGTYPVDGRASDGYWYVRQGLANQAPSIDGYNTNSSIDLGTKTSNFSIDYTIEDPDGGTVTVDIYQDEAAKVTNKTVQLGYRNSYPVDLTEFTLGSHTIKIVARDNEGATTERAYQFYKSNTAPVIDGQDGSLGEKNSPFTQKFNVTDPDMDSVSVLITLNGTEIKNISNAIGQEQQVTITQEMLSGLELGKTNTIVIKADDGKTGISYRRWTFTRVNKPPIISGNDRNIGTISSAEDLSGSFTATDLEGDSISAEVYLNDKLIKTIEDVEAGAENSYSITTQDYVGLSKGEHFIKIKATDGQGVSSERILTFTKRANKMEFILEINKTDVAARKILAVLKQNIAEGDNLTIKACNNYDDANPTWEDITAASLAKMVHNFENAEKTGTDWKLAIWYVCEKNSEEMLKSTVTGISGGYE